MRSQNLGRIALWIKRVGYLLALSGVVYLVVRYDYERVPSDFAHLTPQGMPPGTRIVTMKIGDDTVMDVGSVLLYTAPGHGESLCYGVIAGMPQEMVSIEAEGGVERVLVIGERRERIELPPGHRLSTGRIPADHFLILHGDRVIVSGASFPDSRRLGLIPRSHLRRKVVVPLSFL